ncbi:accessory factor UbiK family protein [Rudaea sp.]|uniref:accessory factor UbiK family protein n=1 Tax=Rudaea sp. TaxID=2136325 RepID=UPI002ED23AE7
MIAVSPLDDLARRLVDLVPPEARERLGAPAREAMDDLSANFKDTLRSGLRRLDLVTREEFDVQRCVLLRTREMVEALEHRVAELETLLGGKAAPH